MARCVTNTENKAGFVKLLVSGINQSTDLTGKDIKPFIIDVFKELKESMGIAQGKYDDDASSNKENQLRGRNYKKQTNSTHKKAPSQMEISELKSTVEIRIH